MEGSIRTATQALGYAWPESRTHNQEVVNCTCRKRLVSNEKEMTMHINAMLHRSIPHIKFALILEHLPNSPNNPGVLDDVADEGGDEAEEVDEVEVRSEDDDDEGEEEENTFDCDAVDEDPNGVACK